MNLRKFLIPVLGLTAVILTSCDSPKSTVAALEKDIMAFKADPDDTKQTAIENGFDKLDQQIAALRSKGKTLEAAEYERQAATLRGDYKAAKVARAIQDAKNAFQGLGDAVKEGAKSIGEAFKTSGTSEP